ncbi:unnamed protein product [Didymodactylos carnosus]|uniref:TRPM SLOG domain-containing protein n=1 Tax=Didymodactylos carnosus TaxID=1234261 RepID=A0A8S2SL18_9BILA|nr:unnamed protein product [Didymodactylos carnosus]CAF4237782.1 unnamed protein product [Didymodactylos carnosus]
MHTPFLNSKTHDIERETSVQSPLSSIRIENYIKQYPRKENRDNLDKTLFGNCDLEPNHTHFLLFDDNTSDRKNVIEARTQIEQLFSTTYYTNIPIVMILIGGDYWSFVALCAAVNVGTPVIIVKHTQGLAKVLTKVIKSFNLYEKLQDDNMKNVHGENYKKIIEDLKSLSPTFNGQIGADTQEANKILEDNIEILRKNKNLIVIFDANKAHNLEDAIADALLQSILKKQKQAIAQLDEKKFDLTKVEEIQWAMIWNKVEYARKHILNDEEEEFTLTQCYVVCISH